jgi:glucan phosphoethanolaminetransferase (alkaline phosphatase superfamily)
MFYFQKKKWLPSISSILKILLTFVIVTLAWIFFRAENIDIAFDYIGRIFTSTATGSHGTKINYLILIGMIGLDYIFYAVSIKQVKINAIIEYVFGAALLVLIILFFDGANNEFIYFDF